MNRDELRALFDYRDGKLFWKVRTSRKSVVGRQAGSQRPDGYWQLRHRNKMYLQHRLIWSWHHGGIPHGMVVDHIDRNPSNNRLENLRLLTHAQNVSNADARSDSSTGFRGVYKLDSRYRNPYRAAFRQKHLGTFATLDEAKNAYNCAVQSFIGGM